MTKMTVCTLQLYLKHDRKVKIEYMNKNGHPRFHLSDDHTRIYPLIRGIHVPNLFSS